MYKRQLLLVRFPQCHVYVVLQIGYCNHSCNYEANCERSFSVFKLTKSYLRSTMIQLKLTGLAILSIDKAYLNYMKSYCNAYLKISWASQKIKIMFHVFRHGGKWLGIFFQVPKPIQGGGTSTTMSLRVVCSRLVFEEVTSPKHTHL